MNYLWIRKLFHRVDIFKNHFRFTGQSCDRSMCPSTRVFRHLSETSELGVELVFENYNSFISVVSLSHPAMLKSIVRAAGAAVRVSSVTSSSTTRTLPFRCAALCSPCSATTRPFTRSLWMLSNNGASSGYRPKLFSSNVIKPPLSCGCGGLHTEGGLTENQASSRTSLLSTKCREASFGQWKRRVTLLIWLMVVSVHVWTTALHVCLVRHKVETSIAVLLSASCAYMKLKLALTLKSVLTRSPVSDNEIIWTCLCTDWGCGVSQG